MWSRRIMTNEWSVEYAPVPEDRVDAWSVGLLLLLQILDEVRDDCFDGDFVGGHDNNNNGWRSAPALPAMEVDTG